MRSSILRAALCLLPLFAGAQQPVKKPLDHGAYDGWESIGAKAISHNGQWVVYTVTPQEGDARLVIYDNKSRRQMEIARGANAIITEDSKYVIFSIRPFFLETRMAKIKKKKSADMPKDSLGIVTLEQWQVWKAPRVASFKAPVKGSGVMAYLLERPQSDKDSTGGAPLVIRDLYKGKEDTIAHALEYAFSKPGNKLLIETATAKNDPDAHAGVLLRETATGAIDTLSRGEGERKRLSFDEKGLQAAWYCTRDSTKAPQRRYELYYYKTGQDSAIIAAGRNISSIPSGWGVSDNGDIYFSNNGQRLFFGTAPLLPPKDTTLVDFEVAKVDIWHYQDDYLQTMQLKNVDKELKRSYLAVYDPTRKNIIQLGDKDLEILLIADEGNAPYALGYTDKGNRISLQWTGRTLKTAWLVNVTDGSRRMIREKLDGSFYISPKGHYVYWYDMPARHWFALETGSGAVRNITSGISTAMYDEEDDHPDEPESYGVAGWLEDDKYAYIYDRYDIWKTDPTGKEAPQNITQGLGRQEKLRFRNIRLDSTERFFKNGQALLLETFNETNKYNGFYQVKLGGKPQAPRQLVMGPYSYPQPAKAKQADVFVFTRGSYQLSPDVYTGAQFDKAIQISHINPQQQQYNWGNASLYKWAAYDGKPAEGILYKPEDFDSTRHYPMIIYFYEKLSDGLYNYQPPAPTPSRLNISFFVSRGYLVFAPDIRYENGHPGRSAYNYIVSGARALARNAWVDSTNIAIQGQSWGGYQVAYLITQTQLFKAAWAGAPVANMTSAYGGIRWESGMNRQMQYEHGQSRIGAALWDQPELYIENSPLFHLPAVTTPLAIMSNDADGAVPWYQGIELFTGLRRLGKPVWLLNYNNEAHNLVHRQNRKDIQRRQQQFFDHFLKNAPAPLWLKQGIPATQKGVSWGWE